MTEDDRGIQAHLVSWMESAAHILKAEVAPVRVTAGTHVFPSAQAAKIGKYQH